MYEPLNDIYWRLGAQYDGSTEEEKPTRAAKAASPGSNAPMQDVESIPCYAVQDTPYCTAYLGR